MSRANDVSKKIDEASSDVDLEAILKAQEEIQAEVDAADKALAKYKAKRGYTGLIPDDVKNSADYKKDKAVFDKAFKKLQDFNKKIPAKVLRDLSKLRRSKKGRG